MLIECERTHGVTEAHEHKRFLLLLRVKGFRANPNPLFWPRLVYIWNIARLGVILCPVTPGPNST